MCATASLPAPFTLLFFPIHFFFHSFATHSIWAKTGGRSLMSATASV